MIGLRTKEDEKFIRYFKIVQKEAEKNGFVFFLDFGECNDIKYNDMIIDENYLDGKYPLKKQKSLKRCLFIEKTHQSGINIVHGLYRKLIKII